MRDRTQPIQPQLATLEAVAPNGEDWLHEIKFDGYRIIARLVAGRTTLQSRNGKDWTSALPPVAAAMSLLQARSATLDGEVVALDREGRSSFQRLQRALGGRDPSLVYYIFDILEKDGRDLRPLPLIERKRILGALLGASPATAPTIRFSDHTVGDGPRVFEHACNVGAEGIVSKRALAPYRPGRSRDWLKIKCTARQEFVIGGYTDPSGSRPHLGALLLGVYKGRDLLYVGRVGTGFDTRTLGELARRLGAIERDTSPFSNPPRGAAARGVHWVEPKLVAEVAFAEWTEEGILRHPSFLGLRMDKSARLVKRESPDDTRRPAGLRARLRTTDPRKRR